MTLRDWFAGQALAGMGIWSPKTWDDPDEVYFANRAKWAYAQADAMLKERYT
jgi:hypothetical protein